jgi:hypothetical protein
VEKVSVNKGLLVGVVGLAATSLLAVAFLLGRASGPGSAPVPSPGGELSGGKPAPDSVLRGSDPVPAGPASKLSPITGPSSPSSPWPALPAQEERAAPQVAPDPAPVPAIVPPGPVASDPERGAVAAYLDAVDRIQPGQASGDPQSVANEMAAALARGDASGLDGMIRDAEAARGRLAALAPPAPCAAHHRESLGGLDDALGMLRSLKTAMESPDPVAQLAGIANRAATVRSRAEALQGEELALRRRYGLVR